MLGTGISQAATFLALLIVARMLGSDGFGEYGMVQSTIGMLGLFAGIGLGLTTTKYVGELRSTNPQRCGRIIGLSTILSGVTAGAVALGLLLIAPSLAAHQLNAPHLTMSLRIASATLLFSALTGVQTGTLMGLEAFRLLAFINIIRAILTMFLVIFGARILGVSGVFAGMGVTSLVVFMLAAVSQRSACRQVGIRADYRNARSEARTLWGFSLPGFVALLLPGIVFWIIRSFIVQSPNGYAELGIFTAAEQWTQIIIFVAANLNQVGLPILSNLYGSSDWFRYRRMVLGNILLPVLVTSLFAVVVLVGAPLISGIYGKSFTGLSSVIRVLAAVAVLQVLGGTLGNLMASMNQLWWAVLFNALWAIVLILATRLLANDGAIGLSLAYLIAYSCHAVWESAFSWRRMQVLKASWTT
jgi:O-antigen/teichoic acid export membrane protein